MKKRRFRVLLNCLSLTCIMLAGASKAAEIVSAVYSDPTTRYAHGILGDAIEYGALELTMSDGRRYTLALAQSQVFEDIAPNQSDCSKRNSKSHHNARQPISRRQNPSGQSI